MAAPPPSRRALAASLLLAVAARATLVLTSEPPAGFNTFMSYAPADLNATSLPALAALFAASPLARMGGFVDFVVDGGWSNSWLPNGSSVQHLDGFGRPVPAPERFPGGLRDIAIGVRALGLKFGLWHIRGIHVDAAARRLPVKGMPQYTLDMLVDAGNPGGGPNGSCLWAPEWLGVNASHPAAQAYYDSIVEQLVENLGADVIKGDCFFCRPCYSSEMLLVANSVKARPEPVTLYLSPGGGALVSDGQWAADNQVATFYRTITDFDSGDFYDWGGLQQAVFIAGNFSDGGLHGANGPGHAAHRRAVVAAGRARGAARPRPAHLLALVHGPLPAHVGGPPPSRLADALLLHEPAGACAQPPRRGCSYERELLWQLHLHGRAGELHHPARS